MPTTGVQDPVRFFYGEAGYSWGADETPDQGRMRGARTLAAAEARLKAGPYFVEFEPDPEPWAGCEPYAGPLWIVCLYRTPDDGLGAAELIGAIGQVPAEQGDPYLRVIAAELAAEHIPAEDPYPYRDADDRHDNGH